VAVFLAVFALNYFLKLKWFFDSNFGVRNGCYVKYIFVDLSWFKIDKEEKHFFFVTDISILTHCEANFLNDDSNIIKWDGRMNITYNDMKNFVPMLLIGMIFGFFSFRYFITAL